VSIPVVCFIPCCKAKNGTGKIVTSYLQPDVELEQLFCRLKSARQGMAGCVETASKKTSAFYLYSGHFYSISGLKPAVVKLIRSGQMRLFIISAGYGLLDAFEPIHKYEAVMSSHTARYWRDVGLTEIIADVCVQLKPEQVYGFFAGVPEWRGTGAKYRYFFTAGVQQALRKGWVPAQAGCFYRRKGRGVTSIMKSLGTSFYEFINSGFQEAFLQEVKLNGFCWNNVEIAYDDMLQ
jgi:hypothetical protein